jgi:hypothetical protein
LYIQRFVKGIAGRKDPTFLDGPTMEEAFDSIAGGHGILSNWWRNKSTGSISPHEVAQVLTAHNLDRHLHDYAHFGPETPFISLASGAVERDALLGENRIYSARDTALEFATDSWARPGALFYGWTPAGLNPAVGLRAVAETVRDLNVYRRWSPYQPEGEVTAKVHIPANQIECVEWWDPAIDRDQRANWYSNPNFEPPDPITNIRDLF